MKSNEVLQKDVQDAIKWEPLLNAAEIGVTVKDGMVTLTGVVDTYEKKEEAEKAAKSKLAEFSINSIDIKMTKAFLFTSTPTTPMTKSAEQKKI